MSVFQFPKMASKSRSRSTAAENREMHGNDQDDHLGPALRNVDSSSCSSATRTCWERVNESWLPPTAGASGNISHVTVAGIGFDLVGRVNISRAAIRWCGRFLVDAPERTPIK